ncbi:HNH endonuclease [Kribbella turkmenica]|uniref:HNH endonuclease n=1 Tax=Kribbella turkmenica TaxID=2530375 RepID=UPI00192D91A4|nr:HNH endonuclease signature motif containing protein [Kribbella turkmenica]
MNGEEWRLPEPDSEELRALVPGTVEQRIYGFLFRRRQHPPTMAEIEAFAASQAGRHATHVNRRVRVLRECGLDVPAIRDGKEFRYHLKGWRPGGPRHPGPRISDKLRAQILAPQRCAQCGRTPLDHGVVLVVDHKVPRDWGGGDEPENLQPLCEQCNGGKRSWYQSYSGHADEIRAAIGHEEVHRRIGELLKALQGQWVPTELIGIVASAAAYQEDYQKRTREFRTLDWEISVEKRYNEGARVRTYYKCTHWEPWPEGSISAEIRRRERANKAAKTDGTA